MAHPSASVTLSDLTFAWPDGSPVLDGLDAVFGSGRTGLVGLRREPGRDQPRSGAGADGVCRLQDPSGRRKVRP